ncbi:MAG: type II secretion system protein N [Burkholderiales bacterium]
MSSRSFAAGLALAVAITTALTVAVRAPAAWVSDWLQSHGRLCFVDPRGTVWNGSALFGISDGRQIMLVPGRVSWRIGWGQIVSARILADVSHPALAAPIAVSFSGKSIALKNGQAELPAALLSALGVPFNTVRPGGVLAVSWTDIEIGEHRLAGDVRIDWRDAQSALSPVAPLGSYRLEIAGMGDAVRLRLDTLRGPLRLQGSGTLKEGRLSFKGLASSEPEMRQALSGLIGVLGPRSGDDAILYIEKL